MNKYLVKIAEMPPQQAANILKNVLASPSGRLAVSIGGLGLVGTGFWQSHNRDKEQKPVDPSARPVQR